MDPIPNIDFVKRKSPIVADLETYCRDDLVALCRKLETHNNELQTRVKQLAGDLEAFDSSMAFKTFKHHVETSGYFNQGVEYYRNQHERGFYGSLSNAEREEKGIEVAIEALKHNPSLWPRRIPVSFRKSLPLIYTAVSRDPVNAYPRVEMSIREKELNLAKIAVIGTSCEWMTVHCTHFSYFMRNNPEFYWFAIDYWSKRHSSVDVNDIFRLSKAAQTDLELILKYVGPFGLHYNQLSDEIKTNSRVVKRAINKGVPINQFPEIIFKKDCEELCTYMVERDPSVYTRIVELEANSEVTESPFCNPHSPAFLSALLSARSMYNGESITKFWDIVRSIPADIIAENAFERFDNIGKPHGLTLFMLPLEWATNKQVFDKFFDNDTADRFTDLMSFYAKCLADVEGQRRDFHNCVRNQLISLASLHEIPFSFPSTNPQKDSRWVEVVVDAIEHVFGTEEKLLNIVKKRKASFGVVETPLWKIICSRFPDNDEIALIYANTSYGCKFDGSFSSAYWSMMPPLVRERRSFDTNFIDKMIFEDPSDKAKSDPFAPVNIIGNEVLMNDPSVVTKALNAKSDFDDLVVKIWKALNWKTLADDQLRNFFLSNGAFVTGMTPSFFSENVPDHCIVNVWTDACCRHKQRAYSMQKELVVAMQEGKIDGRCKDMVSTPHFVLSLITNESVPLDIRKNTFDTAIENLPKNDYNVAVAAMTLFGVDAEGGITDSVEARLLQIAAKNHMDNVQRRDLERRERHGEGTDGIQSNVEKDSIFLRSLLYDLRKYFTPRVEHEILDKKLFLRDPPSNYKRVILMADVSLEDMPNDFIVNDDEAEEAEETAAAEAVLEQLSEEEGAAAGVEAMETDDADGANANIQLQPATLKRAKQLLDRYANAASMITRTAQRLGNYNNAYEMVEDFKGLSVTWSLPDWEKHGRERTLLEIDNDDYAEGVYRLRTKNNGRVIVLPEEITATMPQFEFSGVLWPGYGEPPNTATKASRVLAPTIETYKNITFIVTDVSNEHPELNGIPKPTISQQMAVINGFHETMPVDDAPLFVKPIKVHEFTSDAALQELQKQIHLRGGIGIKTFDSKMKSSKVDRHVYKHYANEIIEFIQRPTLLGALTTVEDTEGAMSFYATSKLFAEREKESLGLTRSARKRPKNKTGRSIRRRTNDADCLFGIADAEPAPEPEPAAAPVTAAAASSSSAYLSGAFDPDSDSDDEVLNGDFGSSSEEEDNNGNGSDDSDSD